MIFLAVLLVIARVLLWPVWPKWRASPADGLWNHYDVMTSQSTEKRFRSTPCHPPVTMGRYSSVQAYADNQNNARTISYDQAKGSSDVKGGPGKFKSCFR